MAASQPGNFNLQEFTDAGQLLVAGRLYTYAYGTTAPKIAYTDPAGAVPHTYTLDGAGGQYIALNARGELPAPLYLLGDGPYDITLKRPDGSTVWTRKADGVDNAANNGIAALAATMASTDGPGAMGFDFAKNYVVSTIGWATRITKRGINVLRYIPPAMWVAIAAGTSNDDHTTYLQAAYNAASNSMEREVYHPAGKYNFTQLYLYNDPALNPGYNVNRNGEMTLTGDGISPENGGSCGTVLYSTLAVGDAFNVGSAANDAAPYNTRDFVARNISFEGGTTGSLVLARGVVSARFEGCQFVQSNAAGTALWATTNYFGVIEKCRFRNTAAGAKTGDAIKFGTTITAGLFSMRDCNVSGFANGLNMYSGQWQLLSVQNTEMSGSAYAIYINGTTQVLNLDNVYFEGVCTSFITDTAANKVQNLNMFGCWALGSGLTGPAINLNAPNSVQIIGGYSQDQNTSWLNIAAAPSGGTSAYAIHGFTFPRTGPAPAAVTLFTGIDPALHGVDYANTDPNVKLFTTDSKPIISRPNFAGSSYLAAGHNFCTSVIDYGAVAGGSLDTQASGFVSWVKAYCSGADTTVYLAASGSGIPHGFDCTVTSSDASVGNLVVKTAIADGAATVGTVKPGTQRMFKFFKDSTATGWK